MKKVFSIFMLTLLLFSCEIRNNKEKNENSDQDALLDLQMKHKQLEDKYEKLQNEFSKVEAELTALKEKNMEKENKTVENDNDVNNEQEERETREESLPVDTQLVYVNDNPKMVVSDISFSLAKVYFEPNRLVCKTYIYNGTDTNIMDIKNVDLTILNKEGVVAHAKFNGLEELVISPNTYKEWTFYFYGNTVQQKDGDLSQLSLTAECEYRNLE